ncbi:amidohydrolase [Deinococcus sp.]|uniref:amidohydrolase n=1 Tax=Deinococcus sp. TaxID=47478 RepID=UPI0025F7A855|nr:amidohydrolase [Deinococcus sp.]
MSQTAHGSAPLLILARTVTQNPGQPEAGAVLVQRGRVLAVGSREDLQARAPGAAVLDHRDLILTPGLCDAHIHLVSYGFSLTQLKLHGVRSVAEVTAKVAQRAVSTPPGEWICGGGFLMSELGLPDYPTSQALDAVSGNRPVLLYSRDLHLAWANSRALELAGITEQTPDPAGGRIIRPLGTLLEAAAGLAARAMPAPTGAQILAAAKAGADNLARRGYVSAHTMAYEDPSAALALQQLAAQGELPLRIWACLPHSQLDRAPELIASNSALFQYGGVKFFADGALGSRTAWLHAPGFADGSGTGIALDSPELIRALGRRALDLGLVPVTHAIGDRANTEVLDAYDDLRELAARRGLKLRIEHAQHLRPADIPRFAGLVASAQPVHLPGDAAMIRTLLPHLEASSYAFRSLQAAGAVLAFGSDAPVAAPDVRAGFAAAITRVGDGAALGADEALSLDATLHAFTRGPALAALWDDEGLIQPGSRAAFTLWDSLGGQAQALVL